MDSLDIQGLTLLAKIGIHPWEKKILQRLVIDIHIPMDFSEIKDEIEDTLDYDKLCKFVSAYIETQSFNLIETLALSLILEIKSTFKLQSLTLSVSKPNAVLNAKNIKVTVSR